MTISPRRAKSHSAVLVLGARVILLLAAAALALAGFALAWREDSAAAMAADRYA
jgi:hypothetical protein